MGQNKKTTADRLLLAGVGLFIGVQLFVRYLSKQHDSFDAFPLPGQAGLIIVFIVSILLLAIGGFLSIGRQGGAKNPKQYFAVFFKGFWHAAKLPIIVTLFLLLILIIYALVIA